MMAWTAKWSSMTFSLMAPVPRADVPPMGNRALAGTSFLPRGANVGGAWYPGPPAAEFRKNESQDWKERTLMSSWTSPEGAFVGKIAAFYSLEMANMEKTLPLITSKLKSLNPYVATATPIFIRFSRYTIKKKKRAAHILTGKFILKKMTTRIWQLQF